MPIRYPYFIALAGAIGCASAAGSSGSRRDPRHHNGAQAGARFGLQNTAGVIEVRMK